jgi:hypothetical protein
MRGLEHPEELMNLELGEEHLGFALVLESNGRCDLGRRAHDTG